ncbi:MAG: HlyD family efflux transporter periplasmic adaptor subunit [Paracoccaceae bacterium]|nr:HlyD family efflux transporter periplasmic adaptor subunit [Paracoccaceae bacterium]
MRFLRRSLVGLFLISLTIGIFAWAGDTFRRAVETRMAQETVSRPAREQIYAVNVVDVQPTTITPVLTSFGEIRSRRTLELRASAGGRIVYLDPHFEDGGFVVADQLLLRVDQSDAEASFARVRADIAEVEAEIQDAERGLLLAIDELRAAEEQADLREQALIRQESLLARGAGTEAAVEAAKLASSSARQAVLSRRSAVANAESQIGQTRTMLGRLQINLAEAQRALEATEVRAAFDGNLAEVAVVEGGIVSSNERLARLVDPIALEVTFQVSNAQYVRLLNASDTIAGAKVAVSLDVQDAEISALGLITRESVAVAEGQTGRLLYAGIEDARGFKPGDFVTVRVSEPPLENVASIPASAVDPAQTVLVVNAENRLEIREVEVLRRQGNNLIVAAMGLEGQRVVLERSPLLGVGIRVRILGDESELVQQQPRSTNRSGATPQTGAGQAGEHDNEEMISLDEDRRAKLIAFVEGNGFMPEDVKARMLNQLQNDEVPKQIVERLESRMGG